MERERTLLCVSDMCATTGWDRYALSCTYFVPVRWHLRIIRCAVFTHMPRVLFAVLEWEFTFLSNQCMHSCAYTMCLLYSDHLFFPALTGVLLDYASPDVMCFFLLRFCVFPTKTRAEPCRGRLCSWIWPMIRPLNVSSLLDWRWLQVPLHNHLSC